MSYSPTPVPLVFLFIFCLLEHLGEQFIGFSLQKVVLSDKSLGELVAQCELEFVIGLVLLCRAGPRILTLTSLLVALAFLKLRNALGLGLCPRIVIVRGRHVEPIDATIL